MKKIWLIFLIICNINMNAFASGSFYKDSLTDIVPYKSFQANHPLGILNLNIKQNFALQASRNFILNIDYSCGNLWAPKVNVYIPKDKKVQNYMETMPWHYRQSYFNPDSSACDSLSYSADGILRKFDLELIIPINKKSDVSIGTQIFEFDAGSFPASTFTSDHSIEWFHSNIAGGEDPFARKYYGFDNADLEYIDTEGNKMILKNGDIFLQGFSFSYHRYFQFAKFYFNTGIHLGLSTNRFNKSLDFGFSSNCQRIFQFKHKRKLRTGIGVSIASRQVIQFQNNIIIGNNKYPFKFETIFSYHWKHKTKNIFYAFTTNFLYQNAYNLGFPYQENNKYLVFSGERISSHWHLGGTHLFRNIQTWNYVFTIHHKISYSIYFQQDWRVNNSPDLQTGISFSIPLK